MRVCLPPARLLALLVPLVGLSVASAQDAPVWSPAVAEQQFYPLLASDFALGWLLGVLIGGISLFYGRRKGKK